MDFLLRVIQVLPLADWLALGAFFAGWVGYVRFAKARSVDDMRQALGNLPPFDEEEIARRAKRAFALTFRLYCARAAH